MPAFEPKRAAMILAASVVAISPLARVLQADTWTGAGATGSWVDGANWGGTAPAPGAALFFDGALQTATVNDYANNTLFSGITFNSTAAAFSLSGNAINLAGDILNTSTAAQAISVSVIQLLQGTSITSTSSALTVSSAIAGGIASPITLTLAGDSSYSGVIANGASSSLALAVASGTVVVSNANTFTGGVAVNGGTLRAVQTASLPGYNSPGKIAVAGGATLSVSAGGSGQWGEADIDTLRSNAVFATGSVLGLNVDSGVAFTYNSSIANGFSLTKSGSGTLTLTGANTYTGATTVTGGTLESASPANIPGYGMPGRVVVAAMLRVGAGTSGWTSPDLDALVTNATFVTGSTLRVNVSDAATISANIGQPLGLNKEGFGTLFLTGTNTYAGPTVIVDGTLSVANGSQLGSGANVLRLGDSASAGSPTLAVTGSGPITISQPLQVRSSTSLPGILTASTPITFTGGIMATQSTVQLNINNSALTAFSNTAMISDGLGARTLRLGGTGNVLISGNIVDNGTNSSALQYSGTAKLTLSGTNTQTGATIVMNGTLSIADGAQLGASSAIFRWGDSTTPAAATPTLEVTSASPVTINQPLQVRSVPASPGVLSAATPITFTGGITALQATSQLFINNSALTTFTNTVRISDGSSNRVLRISGSGNVLISGNVVDNTGTSGIQYDGSGKLTLSGNNTNTGVFAIINGTLSITDGAQLPGTSTQVFRFGWDSSAPTNAPAVLEVTSTSPVTIGRLIQIRTDSTNYGLLNASTPITFTGGIQSITGTGGFVINNTALTTFANTVKISDGSSNRTLRLGGSGNILFSGDIANNTGTSGLQYNGTGKVTLGSTGNSFTGGLTVIKGTVSINDGLQLGGSTNVVRLGDALTPVGANPTLEVTGANPITISRTFQVRSDATMPAVLSAAVPVTFTSGVTATTANAQLNINNTALTTFTNTVTISDGTSNRTLLLGGSGNVLISGNIVNNAAGGTSAIAYGGTATLTLSGANTYTGATTVNSGTLVTPAPNTSAGVSINGGTLKLQGSTAFSKPVTIAGATGAWVGKLDLGTASLVQLNTATANKSAQLMLLANQVNSAKAAGWTGNGITSSSNIGQPNATLAVVDNADLGLASLGGQALDVYSVFVTRTLTGDVNLDGNVDLGDYDKWYKNVGTGTAYSYAAGDINMDGNIDLGDYDLWYSHVGAAPLSLTSQPASAGNIAAVPEPASLAVLAIGSAAILGRRRRH